MKPCKVSEANGGESHGGDFAICEGSRRILVMGLLPLAYFKQRGIRLEKESKKSPRNEPVDFSQQIQICLMFGCNKVALNPYVLDDEIIWFCDEHIIYAKQVKGEKYEKNFSSF